MTATLKRSETNYTRNIVSINNNFKKDGKECGKSFKKVSLHKIL